MPLTALAATVGKPAASILSKAALTWLTSQFLSHSKSTTQDATAKKIWMEVVSNVVRQTQKTAERLSKITTVAFPNHPVQIESIYVPVVLEHSTISACEFTIDEHPKDLLADEKKIILIDGAGMGKSTLSRVLYIKSIQEMVQLPILIDLRRLTRASKIETVLADQFGVRASHLEVLTELLFTKPILFIFDGFDEVADSEKAEVSRVIRHFVDRASDANFIITSRPELVFSDYTDFSRFRIRGLTTERAYQLIRKYGVAFEAEECARALIDDLKAKHDDAVHSFLQNPLLTSLLFRTYDYRSIVPVKRSLFYKQIFEALYEAHDLNKETAYVRSKRTGLHQDDFHSALRGIASQFRLRKVIEIKVSEFLALSRDLSKSQCPGLMFSAEDFLHDVTHAIPLFTKEGDLIRWSHKSLLDYFLAEFLLRDYAKSKEEALRRLAFGGDAFANENLLSLIQEADPILFAQAVTLPAASAVLERYRRVFASLPDDIDEGVANDIANFCASYEVVFSPDSTGDPAKLFETYESDADKHAHVSCKAFLLLMIYNFSGTESNVGIFVNVHAAGLTVATKIGGLASTNVYEIARKYHGATIRESLNGTEKMRSLCESRFKDGDFGEIEEDFVALMGLIGRSDLVLSSAEQLRKAVVNLGKAVEATMKARSDDVF